MVGSALSYILLLGNGIVPAIAIAGDAGDSLPTRQLNEICQQIAASVSNESEVFLVPSSNYAEDISHFMSSSTQLAECSFEPGISEDVGIALQILGQSGTPFAVKGGGHTGNPGFSSTPGVQIAMTRFSDVSYNSTAQTVTVGAGLIWDDVYAALEPYGVNVVGGRVTGVGVAGFTLGGGYSWLTNQYGLTIDTVQAYEVALPNGTVVNVTETTNPDLFFALKGGLNNFGIVTGFTLNVFPQTQVWGGPITYAADYIDQVNLATANFAANNSDPKAAIITSYDSVAGVLTGFNLIFYDAPSPPGGLFDEFMAIGPALTNDVSTRSFLSLVQSAPSNATAVFRGLYNTISVTGYPLALIDSIVNETTYWGENLLLDSGLLISYGIEVFLPILFSHNTTPSAYPPSRTEGFMPLVINYAWSLATSDQVFQDAARTSASSLVAQAINVGQNITNAPLYPNYAIFDTSLVNMYGANLLGLQATKAAVDPNNVMGLAGGFKF